MKTTTVFILQLCFLAYGLTVHAQLMPGKTTKAKLRQEHFLKFSETEAVNTVSGFRSKGSEQLKDFGDIYYEEHFSGGIPAGWTTQDIQGNDCIWQWTDVGATGPTSAGYMHVLASTTANDGWMILDSDNYGALSYDAVLTSPAFDFTAIDFPMLVFKELYKRWGQEACSPVGGNPTFIEFNILFINYNYKI